MKSVFPLSKDYENNVVKTAQQAALRSTVDPFRHTTMEPTGPISKFNQEDLQKVNQAHDLLTQITSRVSQQGGVGTNESQRAPKDLAISRALNGALSILEKLQDMLMK